jgi:hypothetical protein
METSEERLGRFGHHPDPAIDFCIEVEELQSIHLNRMIDFENDPALETRVEKAIDFRVGADLNAIDAKRILRGIYAALRTEELTAAAAGP